MGFTAAWYTSDWLAPGPSTRSNSNSLLGMLACLQRGAQHSMAAQAERPPIAVMSEGTRPNRRPRRNALRPTHAAPGSGSGMRSVPTPHALSENDQPLAIRLGLHRPRRLALWLGGPHAHEHFDAFYRAATREQARQQQWSPHTASAAHQQKSNNPPRAQAPTHLQACLRQRRVSGWRRQCQQCSDSGERRRQRRRRAWWATGWRCPTVSSGRAGPLPFPLLRVLSCSKPNFRAPGARGSEELQ